jgi:hypothetical protein
MTAPLSSSMRDGEWRLSYPGVEYAFGTPATPVFNRTTPDLGDVDIRVSDVDRPRADGRAFGVDFRGGRTISFDLGLRARSEAEVRQEAARLQQVWRADAVRSTAGALATLTTQYAGRQRVIYGRPRRLAVDYSDAGINSFVTAVADFAAIDDLFYDADEYSAQFGSVPPTTGGLVAPLAAPLSTTRSSSRATSLRVNTEMPTWPVIRIYGPMTNPVLNIGDEFEIEVRLSLRYDEFVHIDTRPWARSAMRNGYANVSGLVRGSRLSQAALGPGNYPVGIKGMDPTGTARVSISWTPVYVSL